MENAISETESLKKLAKDAILSLTEEELEMVIAILTKQKEERHENDMGKDSVHF